MKKNCINNIDFYNFAGFKPKKGLVAEWLGGGLQNHIQRFESARDLTIKYKKNSPANKF